MSQSGAANRPIQVLSGTYPLAPQRRERKIRIF